MGSAGRIKMRIKCTSGIDRKGCGAGYYKLYDGSTPINVPEEYVVVICDNCGGLNIFKKAEWEYNSCLKTVN